jgi:hypothetical protein
MSDVQACATCHFWEEQSKHCRRYAPSPTLGNSDRDEPQTVSWVLTDAEDWCGDYEPVFEDEDVEEYEEGEDVEWEADGTPKWSPPPPTPPARRGLFG